jgi:hypothetical protein
MVTIRSGIAVHTISIVLLPAPWSGSRSPSRHRRKTEQCICDDANDHRKDDRHHANNDNRQIENRACLRRLRVENSYNIRNQQRSVPQLHVHRLPSKPAPQERRNSQDSILPSTSQEWKNFCSIVEPALHTGSIAPEISRYSRARE